MRKQIVCLGMAVLLSIAAADSFAASIVCTKKTEKCYFFQTIECPSLYLNPGDACMRAKHAGFYRVRGLKIDSRDLQKGQNALRQARIEFFTAQPPAERGKLLLMVDDLAIPVAAGVLKKVGVASTVQPILQGPLR